MRKNLRATRSLSTKRWRSSGTDLTSAGIEGAWRVCLDRLDGFRTADQLDRLREVQGRNTGSHRVVNMARQRKITDSELESRLKADASNPGAWEHVATVPASKSPRPVCYGKSKHLELAAKFYVLSVLHRMGAEANLTYAQPDNVDIAAVRQSGEAFTIDVKTLTGTTDWPIGEISAREHHFVVFVCFARKWRAPNLVPDLFIWQSQDLKTVIARTRSETISLPAIASQHDAIAAWEQFATEPAVVA